MEELTEKEQAAKAYCYTIYPEFVVVNANTPQWETFIAGYDHAEQKYADTVAAIQKQPDAKMVAFAKWIKKNFCFREGCESPVFRNECKTVEQLSKIFEAEQENGKAK